MQNRCNFELFILDNKLGICQTQCNTFKRQHGNVHKTRRHEERSQGQYTIQKIETLHKKIIMMEGENNLPYLSNNQPNIFWASCLSFKTVSSPQRPGAVLFCGLNLQHFGLAVVLGFCVFLFLHHFCVCIFWPFAACMLFCSVFTPGGHHRYD